MNTRELYGLTRNQPHLHWVIWRYDHAHGEDEFHSVTSIELIARTEDEALELAEKIVPKHTDTLGVKIGGYVVRTVTEHQSGQCPHFNEADH